MNLLKLSVAVAAAGCLSAAVAAGPAGKPKAPASGGASKAAPLVWTDVDGRGYGPVQLRAQAATVFVFVSSDCPLASKYASRLRQLQDDYFAKRVAFFLVNSHATDTAEQARAWATERSLSLPVVKDVGTTLADRLGAVRTPEAVVVDREGNVVYRGAIDDRTDETLVRRRYLRETLDAVTAGKPAPAARVAVETGCIIPHPGAKTATGKTPNVTYARDVAPILNRACVPCHRDGEVAPFALGTYEQAKVWAPMIADVTKRRIMPPWKAQPGFGKFHSERSISDAESAALDAWAKAGAPAGDLKTAPKPPTFAKTDWPVTTPDVVVAPEKPYRLAAEGKDEYRCFVLPTTFSEDAFVNLSQVKPGNRSVVHHVILYVDPSGTKALEMNAKDPHVGGDGFDNPSAGAGPPVPGSYPISAWVPGSSPVAMPSGVAMRVPKGSRLVLEVHYHKSGKEETDRTVVGLTFAKGTVDKLATGYGVAQPFLSLPAGEARIPVKSMTTIPEDSTILAVAPHMHQTGKEMHVWAEKPDGQKVEMIWVKDWDFNWQDAYWYQQPLRLPRGTVVKMEAVFDNSASNPRNPHRPPKPLRWGESTTDEMCLAAIVAVKDAQKLGLQPAPWQKAVSNGPAATPGAAQVAGK